MVKLVDASDGHIPSGDCLTEELEMELLQSDGVYFPHENGGEPLPNAKAAPHGPEPEAGTDVDKLATYSDRAQLRRALDTDDAALDKCGEKHGRIPNPLHNE